MKEAQHIRAGAMQPNSNWTALVTRMQKNATHKMSRVARHAWAVNPTDRTHVGFQASSLPYLRRLQVWVYPLVILREPQGPRYALNDNLCSE